MSNQESVRFRLQNKETKEQVRSFPNNPYNLQSATFSLEEAKEYVKANNLEESHVLLTTAQWEAELENERGLNTLFFLSNLGNSLR